jgi:hypothetical protein
MLRQILLAPVFPIDHRRERLVWPSLQFALLHASSSLFETRESDHLPQE